MAFLRDPGEPRENPKFSARFTHRVIPVMSIPVYVYALRNGLAFTKSLFPSVAQTSNRAMDERH